MTCHICKKSFEVPGCECEITVFKCDCGLSIIAYSSQRGQKVLMTPEQLKCENAIAYAFLQIKGVLPM